MNRPTDCGRIAGRARRRRTSRQARGRGQRAQVPLPQADADGDGWCSGRIGGCGVSCGPTAGGRAARGAVTLLYLGYLRRQTRIEERVRCRRVQRMARARPAWRTRMIPSRRGSVAAAEARVRRAGNRRRGPDFRASRLRAGRDGVRPAAGRGPVTRGFRRGRAGSLLPTRGYGAVGSASRSHRVGQGFESP